MRAHRATIKRAGWHLPGLLSGTLLPSTAAVAAPWLERQVPPPLQGLGPLSLAWWQWLGLGLSVPLALLGGVAVSRLLVRLLGRVTRKTSVRWDDDLSGRLRGPLILACALVLLAAIVPAAELNRGVEQGAQRLWRGALLFGFFWAVLRSVDVGAAVILASPWASARSAAGSLTTLGSRLLKFVIVAAALVAFMSELGYPVMSMVAGLGIGGIAVALAAQKTVENLFGAFSLGADEPFHVGDFVKIDDFVGTVETIGLRSTRVRTLDRTLITIPNGKLAEMKIESYAARDRLRLACTVGLVYDTTHEQMSRALTGLEQVLRAHPKIWPDEVVVRLCAFGASSLDIEIMAWFQTCDWGEFQAIRQEILLGFMKVVADAGTSFAFPTTTVRLEAAGEKVVAAQEGVAASTSPAALLPP